MQTCSTTPLSRPRLLAALAALALIVLTAGCTTNLAPVRTFAEQTRKMSATFDPMLAGTVHSCTDNAMRKRLIVSERFDAQASEQAAQADCAVLVQANLPISQLNDVLLRYAETLAALADSKLPVYKKQFAGLGDALGSLQQPGASAPVLDADKLDKVMKLSEHLSRLATQQAQKSSIRALLDEQEALNIVSNALKEYAQRNYLAGLRDEARDLDLLRSAVLGAARREPLAANYVSTRLYLEGRQLRERERIVDAYVRAVDSLQASVAALRSNLDSLQAPELTQQLTQFSSHVETLQQQAVFYGPARW